MTTHVSLKRAHLRSFNISSPNSCIWQHIGSDWSTTHIQNLANVLDIPITQFYSHLIGQSRPILPFVMSRNSVEEGLPLMGKFLTHTGTSMGFLGRIFIAGMALTALRHFCIYNLSLKVLVSVLVSYNNKTASNN